MTHPNLKTQLELLARLQTVDSQIYRLNDEKKLKPREIEVLRLAFEEKKKNLALLEKAHLDAQKEKKDRELELAGKEENTKKLQGQLYQLKTNKEYSTMLQQINDSKADASMIEDRILESMDRIESTRVAVEDEKKRLQQEEAVFAAQKKTVDDRVREIDGLIAQLNVQRKELLPGIDPKIISQYERILHNRDGLAIVPVSGSTCGGCNMSVPPQVVNLVSMYDRLVTCEVCNRILYIPDER